MCEGLMMVMVMRFLFVSHNFFPCILPSGISCHGHLMVGPSWKTSYECLMMVMVMRFLFVSHNFFPCILPSGISCHGHLMVSSINDISITVVLLLIQSLMILKCRIHMMILKYVNAHL